MVKINGIGTLTEAVADLRGVLDRVEENKTRIQESQRKVEELQVALSVAEKEEMYNEMILHLQVANLEQLVKGLQDGSVAHVNERYDVDNNKVVTLPSKKGEALEVYVHTVDGGVPVHDTIEIKGVDRYGTAYTFEGHGVQARNGKWYEKFESGEWEIVVKGGDLK